MNKPQKDALKSLAVSTVAYIAVSYTARKLVQRAYYGPRPKKGRDYVEFDAEMNIDVSGNRWHKDQTIDTTSRVVTD